MDRPEIYIFQMTKNLEKKIEEDRHKSEPREKLWLTETVFRILSTAVKVCINYDGVYYQREGNRCSTYNDWCPFSRRYMSYIICDRNRYEVKISKGGNENG